MTRGIKKEVDDFITQLQGQFNRAKWIDQEGKVMEQAVIQTRVNPIQLWEIVYPKGMHDTFCSTFYGQQKSLNMHKKHKLPVAMIRKGLGVKKLDWKNVQKILPIAHNHMEIVGIGQKADDPLTFNGKVVRDKDGKTIEGL